MKTTIFLLLLTTSLSIRNLIAAKGGEYAATSSQLSLGEVTRPVLQNNPAIKEAENHRWAARERTLQAKASDDPRAAGEWLAHPYDDVPPHAYMDQTLAIAY